MQDLMQHVTNVVKDEIAKACQANGIAKDEAGWAVTLGTLAPVVDQDGRPTGQLSPATLVFVSLRSMLAPFKPVVAALPAYGIWPDDAVIRAIVTALVPQVDKLRRDVAAA